MTWNKAAVAGLGPAVTTILLGLDAKFGWGMGEVFWGAVCAVGFGILAFAIPNKEST